MVVSSQQATTLASALPVERELGSAGDSTFLLVKSDEVSLAGLDDSQAMVLPNYEYEGELFDEPIASHAPSQASPSGRPGHLDIINIEPAWAVTKGRPGVLSAITDTGLDLTHPELKDSLWQNPGETAGNGVDDDGNGKIDDANGWDFSDDDNSPHDVGSQHHTHVHGIVHAREGATGATGVAPGARGMALRIAGGKRRFSSAVMIESYLYALKAGAKSINTSFNIDAFVGDSAIKETYRKLADSDVLLFNSAGNNSKRNPGRQAFEDIVLVASTDTAAATRDKLSEFSNYGVGVDISAPGADIVSTFPGGRVGALSGTSMASPNAMGVDLLVQSAHPEWSRAQRWAQIAGTADKIDALNPENVGELGFGRINAGRALTETLAPPTVTVKPTTFPNGQTLNLQVRFDKVLDTASANNSESWRVLNEQGEAVLKGAPKEVRLLSNQFEVNVGTLPAGNYRFVASAAHLKDPFGQPLDGNGDGKGGDDLVVHFQRIS